MRKKFNRGKNLYLTPSDIDLIVEALEFQLEKAKKKKEHEKHERLQALLHLKFKESSNGFYTFNH